MRGDSLRDLYAKTLALMGLGVLAGAGALVDFWPAGVRLISVSSALQLPEIADESPVVHPAVPGSGSRQVAQPVSMVIARAAAASPDPAVAIEPQDGVLEVAPAVIQAAITDAPLMVLADNVMTESWVPAVPVSQLAMVELAPEVAETLAPGFEAWTAPQPALDGAQNREAPGFLSGALKKTQSLVRTSARTGASIVDAVRVGLGVVRRALPDSRDQSFRPGT